MRPESDDWEVVRELEARLQLARCEFTAQEIATVCRAADQVGMHANDVQHALDMPGGHEELVIEVRRRIREGSQRLMQAFTRAQQLLDQRDSGGARTVLELALAEEQIPFYRETIAEHMRGLGLR